MNEMLQVQIVCKILVSDNIVDDKEGRPNSINVGVGFATSLSTLSHAFKRPKRKSKLIHCCDSRNFEVANY